MKKLLENWALPNRNSEKIAVSLRLPFDVYAKLHALKEVYPSQTVTDIATDILREGLEAVVDALPNYEHTTLEEFIKDGKEQGLNEADARYFYETQTDAPRKRFNSAYQRIFADKAPKSLANEAAETNEEAAK